MMTSFVYITPVSKDAEFSDLPPTTCACDVLIVIMIKSSSSWLSHIEKTKCQGTDLF